MNKVILLGRLTRDPELRKTSQDISVCKFTLAVNRLKEGTDFIECTCFNGTADTISKYIKKGQQLCVEGRLRVDTYKKQDGANGYSTYVLVEGFTFVGSGEHKESTNSIKMEDVELNEFDYPF